MSLSDRDLLFMLVQFLEEEGFKKSARKLEEESGIFFNMRHFEELITRGEWDEVEKYLLSFMRLTENRFSMEVFFEIRKQKYLEAIYSKDFKKAKDILNYELKVIARVDIDLYKEMAKLLTLENTGENENFMTFRKPEYERINTIAKLKNAIESNPAFRDALNIPAVEDSRLRVLINKSLNWQHHLCQNPNSKPEIMTLFIDHHCEESQLNGAQVLPPVTNQLTVDTPKPGGFPPLQADGVSNVPANILHVGYGNQSSNSSYDLPLTVVMTLNQGSTVRSMDFHPAQQTLLLVGTSMGEIIIWELQTRTPLANRSFKVWDLRACTVGLKIALWYDMSASVNRVMWSPDGSLFAVAYSKRVVHVYTYNGGEGLRNYLEIEAHEGSVNDIAFSYPNDRFSIITCGEDRLIKVWDVLTGTKMYTFEGHESSVHSVCPHQLGNIQFIFSVATDGKIKIWIYENMIRGIDYLTRGHSSTTMLHSSDQKRLFSCGTDMEGVSHLVEWNANAGTIKREYIGLGGQTRESVKFDTTKNRFLAVGDDFTVKFWDMDNENLFTTTDAGAALPAFPCLRFNREGNLLAVSTSENGIKILANADGFRLLHTTGSHPFVAPIVPSAAVMKPSVTRSSSSHNTPPGLAVADRVASIVAKYHKSQNLSDVKPKIAVEPLNPTAILELSQCHFLKLPDNEAERRVRITRLMYANSGRFIVALAANAVHKVWTCNWFEENTSRKENASSTPQLLQPASQIQMTNDIGDKNPEDTVSCFALSKNDSYVVSASGGKITLFEMKMFMPLITLMPPPPAATFIALHPEDNNIIAIGMEDSSIKIYNFLTQSVTTNLEGHQKRITGLAFSLNMLVSAGADSQLCVWNTKPWEKQTSKYLTVQAEKETALANTRVQFHNDHARVLVVHETLIGIYKVPELECLVLRAGRGSSYQITDATYSCDCKSIYAGFNDGAIRILNASNLECTCQISPIAYNTPGNLRPRALPLAIAAHPSKPNQFALGLDDGGVVILEPLKSEGQRGSIPTTEHSAGPSSSGAALS